MQVKESELKPCPFCGGKAEFGVNPNTFCKTIWVYCQKCGAETKHFEIDLYSCAAKNAAEAWNRRADNEP